MLIRITPGTIAALRRAVDTLDAVEPDSLVDISHDGKRVQVIEITGPDGVVPHVDVVFAAAFDTRPSALASIPADPPTPHGVMRDAARAEFDECEWCDALHALPMHCCDCGSATTESHASGMTVCAACMDAYAARRTAV